ncbi:MAG: hypothetical protein U9Q77_06600 [Candidatus Marinimicrobia bacterium]|nr:hypothetical protein [Candidatus Neomarinimicrobiota bacterium]
MHRLRDISLADKSGFIHHFDASSYDPRYAFRGRTRIIKGSDGFYYYAVLNSSGEFSPSNEKVGLSKPLATSYHLERSPQRLLEIQEAKEEFRLQMLLQKEEYLQNGFLTEGELAIGIILVYFDDDINPAFPNRPDLSIQTYNNLFFFKVYG